MRFNYALALSMFFASHKVLFGQGHVGIGTINPVAALHVADSAVVFTAPLALPEDPFRPPIIDAGTRMLWYPEKSAFRAGSVLGDYWNKNKIGQYSTAFGYNPLAQGNYAFAFGNNNAATGIGAFAGGRTSLASGDYASVLGYDNEAQAYCSFVIGRYNIIDGDETEWINNDPLFVIGNGYIEDLGGIGQIVRRNALTITKAGIAYFDANVYVDNQFYVDGNTYLDQDLSVGDTARFDGVVGIGINSPDQIQTSLQINGGLSVIADYESIDDGETLTVGNRTFIGITAYELGAVLHLSNGLNAGHILILKCDNYSFTLLESDANLNMAGNRTLDLNDTIVLIWGIGAWYEISYTAN